jgi:TolA-binding protein
MQELRAQMRGFEDKVEALQGGVRNLNMDVAVVKERRELDKDMGELVFATGLAVASGTFMILYMVSNCLE